MHHISKYLAKLASCPQQSRSYYDYANRLKYMPTDANSLHKIYSRDHYRAYHELSLPERLFGCAPLNNTYFDGICLYRGVP